MRGEKRQISYKWTRRDDRSQIVHVAANFLNRISGNGAVKNGKNNAWHSAARRHVHWVLEMKGPGTFCAIQSGKNRENSTRHVFPLGLPVWPRTCRPAIVVPKHGIRSRFFQKDPNFYGETIPLRLVVFGRRDDVWSFRKIREKRPPRGKLDIFGELDLEPSKSKYVLHNFLMISGIRKYYFWHRILCMFSSV